MQTSTINNEALFDLGKLINYLLSKWQWFVSLGLTTAIIFAIISIQLPNQYTSETLLVTADSNAGGLDSLTGQLGGLASLAGVNLNQSKDKSLLALQILKSRMFLVNFVKAHQLEEQLFAVKSWDNSTDTYIYNEDKFNVATKKWLARSDKAITYYPTDLEIHQEMMSIIDIEVDKPNQVTKVMLSYINPVLAQQWLTWLIRDLNENLRQSEIAEREQQIIFLKDQLELQANAEIRNVFYALIEEQLKSSTLAKAREEYAYKVIDPAILPEEKSGPKRALITVLGGLVGGIFCFIFFAIRFVFKT